MNAQAKINKDIGQKFAVGSAAIDLDVKAVPPWPLFVVDSTLSNKSCLEPATASGAAGSAMSLAGKGSDFDNLSKKDKDTGAEIYSGRIALSLSLVPKEEYENDPVGKARDEPNKDPCLPPPQGRLSFTLNPLAILKELCSPRVICCIICCLVCMVLVTAMIFISSQLSGLVAFYQLFSSD